MSYRYLICQPRIAGVLYAFKGNFPHLQEIVERWQLENRDSLRLDLLPTGVPGFPAIKTTRYLSMEGIVSSTIQAVTNKAVQNFPTQLSERNCTYGYIRTFNKIRLHTPLFQAWDAPQFPTSCINLSM